MHQSQFNLLINHYKYLCYSRYRPLGCTSLGMFQTSLQKPAFIPASSSKPAVTFEWITGENNTLQLWDSKTSQPDGTVGQKCALLCNNYNGYDGLWQDDICSSNNLIICETQRIGNNV